MSQKDYIERKRNIQILHKKQDLNHVLNSQQLTDFKSLILSDCIVSSNVEFDPLITSTQQNTIDTNVPVAPDCPTFMFGMNTQQRVHRQNPPTLTMFHRSNQNNGKNQVYWELKKTNQIPYMKNMDCACNISKLR